MKTVDMCHLLDAIDDAIAELTELEKENSWFSSDSLEHLTSARQIITEAIEEDNNNDN